MEDGALHEEYASPKLRRGSSWTSWSSRRVPSWSTQDSCAQDSHSGARSSYSDSRCSHSAGGSTHSSNSVASAGAQGALRIASKVIVRSILFRVAVVLSLAFALLAGSMWTILNIPDDPGVVVLDVLMIIVMIVFLVEIAANTLYDLSYFMSFFFWMDFLGTTSILLEVSFFLGDVVSPETVALRAARYSKLVGQLGRTFRLMKGVAMTFRRHNESLKAKAYSRQLSTVMSHKVAFVTICLIMFMPVFALPVYPEQDLSMKLWSQRLEDTYKAHDMDAMELFKSTVRSLETFYRDQAYAPYKIEVYSQPFAINGSTKSTPELTFLQAVPARQKNIVRVPAEQCAIARLECTGGTTASIYFDFKVPNQVEAAMDALVILFAVAVMTLISLDIKRTTDRVFARPLERILQHVHEQSPELFGSRRSVGHAMRNGESELDILEHILRKLTRAHDLAPKRHSIEASDLAKMDRETQGVFKDMLQVEIVTKRRRTESCPRSSAESLRFDLVDSCDSIGERDNSVTSMLSAPIPPSWSTNTLEMCDRTLKSLVLQTFYGENELIMGTYTQSQTLKRFIDVVKCKYFDNSYHSFAHACDVLQNVDFFCHMTDCEMWLHLIDHYSLLVAALCHDIGHFGMTNLFLCETKHALALQYNDRSPLENMHCSTLFSICSDESTNVFSLASILDQKQSRKVCIATILHTDNIHHFEMVDDVCAKFEMLSGVCEEQAGADCSLPLYSETVLRNDSLKWMQLFLHLADVSNPLKPFDVCHAWALRVLDEFFAQGDEEKRLGIPVGMLNDRDKVSIAGSQHGFMNFLVAPLVVATVRVFPMFQDLQHQMVLNMTKWRDLWVLEANPSAEDMAKKDGEIEKRKHELPTLVSRFQASSNPKKFRPWSPDPQSALYVTHL